MKEKWVKNIRHLPYLLTGLILIIASLSCNLFTNAGPAVPTDMPQAVPGTLTTVAPTTVAAIIPTASPLPSVTPTLTLTPTNLPTQTPTQSPTQTLTELPAQTATETPTATLSPTYTILRGKVLQQSNCRYGPGAPYLYKYGLYEGSNLEIIGRNDLGTWILVQAIGGSNPCWVKASLLQIKGDVMSVAPTYIPLPQSPYYGPPTGVSAVRNGNEVTVSWNAVILRAGDDSEQVPYVIEAWVCTQGELVFTPVGAYVTLATILDEPGCTEPSHGWLYAAEKHGYTTGVTIPWP